MHASSRARKAPGGMRLKKATQLLISGETRAGICGYAPSGGWALSTAASAMPTPSAPSSRAFALTISAVSAMRLSWHSLRSPPHLGETAENTMEGPMDELKVVRLDETEVVKFGPDAIYQLILGDDEGTTPIRTGIQTSQPGYVAPVHSHPSMEVVHILYAVAEAWVDGREDAKVTLRKGDTIAIPPQVPHSFRVVGDEVLRLLGTHASPSRIVNYKDGAKSDARGYRVFET